LDLQRIGANADPIHSVLGGTSMNNHMISQAQREQAEVEQTEEYILDQKMLKLDELLDKLKAKFAESHANDREFNRHLAKSRKSTMLCDRCRKEVHPEGSNQ
jgi:hypothetical protein